VAPAQGPQTPLHNPARKGDLVGHVHHATPADVAAAATAAKPWDASPEDRRATLARAAALFEADFGRLFAILSREAGKNLPDCVGELREAVDFLHFYGAETERLRPAPRGVIACISPWNFPLAIFTGQIAGALAAGNAVLAKPAEQTPMPPSNCCTRPGCRAQRCNFCPAMGRELARHCRSIRASRASPLPDRPRRRRRLRARWRRISPPAHH
jgi:delta 1-pyrroline-5-carboxylate dehydrogenase